MWIAKYPIKCTESSSEACSLCVPTDLAELAEALLVEAEPRLGDVTGQHAQLIQLLRTVLADHVEHLAEDTRSLVNLYKFYFHFVFQ